MEKVKRENKKKIMEMIKKAGDPDNYETSWDQGIRKSKKKSEVKKGQTSKAKGARFELKVRRDLETQGRIVDKWSNNVDLEEGKIIIAKKKFNPFSKVMTIGTGFPDFVAIKHVHSGMYRVIGVEVKTSGILSKIEKEKCVWYLENEIFSEIWIAKAVQKGRKIEIEYIDFRERYPKYFK